MAQSKTPGKTKNPVAHMRQCRLYRWANGDNSNGFFDTIGPFKKDKVDRLMNKAINRKNTWICVVTAYFIKANGDYYEERLVTSPMGPIKLVDELDLLIELNTQLVLEAMNGGDSDEYEDTCTALYMYTPELQAQLDNEEWVESQALVRAKLALEKHATKIRKGS